MKLKTLSSVTALFLAASMLAGCGEAALSACVKMSPERIVMISCNPATAARDCAFLCNNGYSLVSVRGVDMFPRTGHVECVCLLERE